MGAIVGNRKNVVLAAGGTGGHIFAALALADRIKKEGLGVSLMTDHRFNNYRCDNNTDVVEYLPIRSPASGNIAFMFSLCIAYIRAFIAIRKCKPSTVIGFGGYPTFPTLLAALTMGIPIIIHESNAVLGRVNKFFLPFARWVTVAFPIEVSKAFQDKIVFTGNPVSKDLQQQRYDPPDKEINLLIIGGSQGAAVFSKVVPKALECLPEPIRLRLKVFQQCRIEDLEAVRRAYANCNITAEIDTFFVDVTSIMSKSHLVICRAGSGTMTELHAIGRPAIYIPYPHARDEHQLKNATYAARTGTGLVIEEKDFTYTELSRVLNRLFEDTKSLQAMADKSLTVKRLEAADMLLRIITKLS